VQRSVVRFLSVIARSRFTGDEAIPSIVADHNVLPIIRGLLRRTKVLLAMTLLSSSLAYAQKITPLAAQAQSISEYENMIRSGLQLAHGDSILIAFGQMKGIFRTLPRIASPFGKCGTVLADEAYRIQHINKSLIQSIIFSVQSFTDSIKSPSGRFTVYYNKNGDSSALPEYVDSVAHFADEAFELEIVELGYAKPPFTAADSTWHISLGNLGPGIYGETDKIGNAFATSPSGLSLFQSSISINNSFDSGFATLGLDAARITIFHEFHHVIQNGSYGTNSSDDAFREMMAVWMETRSTPWVMDYLQYIPSYTLHFDESFDHIENIGFYGQAIWMQFLAKKFGDDILRHTWEFYSMKLSDFLLSFDSTLVPLNTSFCLEYKRFGTAVYYTGRNFQGTSLFPDARKFNADDVQRTILLPNIPDTILQAFDASLHIFVCGYRKDTSVIVISRSTDRQFNSDIFVTSTSVLTLKDSFQFPETFCGDTISLPTLIATKIFPQPYILTSSTDQPLLNILASTNSYSPIASDLSIYALDNTLIRHIGRSGATQSADPFGGSWYVEWDGRDDKGKLVPSGVYYYHLTIDQLTDNGKFVVIRKN